MRFGYHLRLSPLDAAFEHKERSLREVGKMIAKLACTHASLFLMTDDITIGNCFVCKCLVSA